MSPATFTRWECPICGNGVGIRTTAHPSLVVCSSTRHRTPRVMVPVTVPQADEGDDA